MVLQCQSNNEEELNLGSFVKCFDAVSMVVEEATLQLAPLWKINKEKYRILKQYCGVLDSLSNEFDGESFEVDVDDENMTISIKLECQDITIESQTHKYYSLAQRALSFGFLSGNNGNIIASFVFPSVWEKSM